MKVQLDINTAGVASSLLELHRNQIPFAASKAINATLLDIQKAQRESMGRSFILRRRTWAERSVKIGRGDFATKGKLAGIIRIETPGDPTRSDILGQHEEGGTKRPGGSRLAIPVAVRSSRTDLVPDSKRVRALGKFTHMGGMVWRGSNRTFMVRRPDGRGGIYQRVGPRNKRGEADRRNHRFRTKFVARRDSSLIQLYRFVPEAELEPRLRFEATGSAIAQSRFARNFESAFAHAVATARPRTK